MSIRKTLRAGWMLLALGTVFSSALVLAACGGDDDDDDGGSVPEATAMPTMTAGMFKTGSLEISDVRARTSDTANSAVYMNIKSTGEADRLLSATSSAAKEVQVHETIVDGASMKMQELADGLPIPAGGMVELKTGGYHVMLLDLVEPLKEGAEMTVTLTFEKAPPIEVTAKIMAISAGGSMMK